jgi:hypothetical protein
MHRRQYVYQNCSGTFSDEQALSKHLISAHHDAFTDDQIPAAVRLCNRPEDQNNEQTCVVCERKMTLVDLQSHLAIHMEDIALFILPLAMEDEEASSEASNRVVVEERRSARPTASELAFDDIDLGQTLESISQLGDIETLTVTEKMESWDADESFIMPTAQAISVERSPAEERQTPLPLDQHPEGGTRMSLEHEVEGEKPQTNRIFNDDEGEPQGPLLSPAASFTDSEKTRETDMAERYDAPEEAEEGVWGYLFPLFGDGGSDQRIALKGSNSQDLEGLQSPAPSPQGASELEYQRAGLPKGGYLMDRHTKCGRFRCTLISYGFGADVPDVVMTDLAISNRHCVICSKTTNDRTVAVITDMSSNGTFVNEEILGRNQQRDLQDRDTISITA